MEISDANKGKKRKKANHVITSDHEESDEEDFDEEEGSDEENTDDEESSKSTGHDASRNGAAACKSAGMLPSEDGHVDGLSIDDHDDHWQNGLVVSPPPAHQNLIMREEFQRLVDSLKAEVRSELAKRDGEISRLKEKLKRLHKTTLCGGIFNNSSAVSALVQG